MGSNKNHNNCVVKRTSSFGRKRILILNERDIDFDSVSPTKKQSIQIKTQIQDLPQDIIIRVLCGVEHDDLKRLFHVSKSVREAAVIAKKLHFAYSTPKKVPAFRCFLDQPEFDEIEPPDAPRQLKTSRSRLNKKKLADISVALFASSDDENNM